MSKLRVNATEIKVATVMEDGQPYLAVEVEMDLPSTENWIKVKHRISHDAPIKVAPGTLVGKRDPQLLLVLSECIEYVSRRIAAENHFDDPAALAAHGITPDMVAEWRESGWRPFFEVAGE